MADDGEEENLVDKNNKSDNENEIKNKKNQNQNNIKTVKTQKINNKLFPRTKTPMFNFGELMRARRNNISNNAKTNINTNNNIINNDEVQIVYNKDQDVDIIRQFQDEQNKKLSENIIIENPTHKKVPSTPNFGKGADNTETVVSDTAPFNLSNTPEKTENLAKKILEKKQNNDESENTKEGTKSINSNINNKNSLYSNLNTKNSLYSNINNINNLNSGNINNDSIFKSMISGNTLYTFNSNSNINPKSLFRMTTVKKSNKQSYLSRGSLYDDFLKKNHPDNVRKTMLKKSNFGSKNTISDINEGIKENESESENDEKEKEKEKKEMDNELKKSLKLKYSLTFDDDDENEEEHEEEQSLNSKEDDMKLFNMLDNENDEELKELKKLYFNEEDKDKKVENKKPKSVMKKKSVKFKTDENTPDKDKEKSPDSKLIKSIVSKKSITSNYNLSNSVLEGLDKYEEKLKEINKNYQITNDKNDVGDNGRIRFDSQLEISFHDDNFEKLRVNLYDDYTTYNNDIALIKKLYLNDTKINYNISDIYKLIQKRFLLGINKSRPNTKINIFQPNNTEFNDIGTINEMFIKMNKNKESNENISNGIISLDQNDKENNGSMSAEEIKSEKTKEINNQRREKKRFTDGGNARNKFIIERNKKISKEKYKNIGLKKDESTQKVIIEKFPTKKTIQIRQEAFSIPNYLIDENLNYINYCNNGNNNTYNGNNQIDISKYNAYNGNTYSPNTVNYDLLMNKYINTNNNETYNKNNKRNKDLNSMRYNQSYSNFPSYMNKDNKVNKMLKKFYYKNEKKSPKIGQDISKINKTKYLKPQSPKINKFKDINLNNFSTMDNKKINKFEGNKQLQMFK
jgi:hypothetical protein